MKNEFASNFWSQGMVLRLLGAGMAGSAGWRNMEEKAAKWREEGQARKPTPGVRPGTRRANHCSVGKGAEVPACGCFSTMGGHARAWKIWNPAVVGDEEEMRWAPAPTRHEGRIPHPIVCGVGAADRSVRAGYPRARPGCICMIAHRVRCHKGINVHARIC